MTTDRASDVRHVAKAIAEVVYRLPLDFLSPGLEQHCLIAAMYALRTIELDLPTAEAHQQ